MDRSSGARNQRDCLFAVDNTRRVAHVACMKHRIWVRDAMAAAIIRFKFYVVSFPEIAFDVCPTDVSWPGRRNRKFRSYKILRAAGTN